MSNAIICKMWRFSFLFILYRMVSSTDLSFLLLLSQLQSSDSHSYLLLVLSLGTKREFINRPIWMKRLSPSSAQRYFFSFLLCSFLFPPTDILFPPLLPLSGQSEEVPGLHPDRGHREDCKNP